MVPPQEEAEVAPKRAIIVYAVDHGPELPLIRGSRYDILADDEPY
jgi:hypothetical protein